MKQKFTARELLQFEHYLFLKKSIADLERQLKKHLNKITNIDPYLTTADILVNCVVKDNMLYHNGKILGEKRDNYFICDKEIYGDIYFATAVKGTYIGFYFEC